MSAATCQHHHQDGTADMGPELQRLRAREKAAHARYLRLSRRGGAPALDEAFRIAEDLGRMPPKRSAIIKEHDKSGGS
jgi:hypothetical protein